ncbi:TATA-binding protein-associated factor 172-like [Stegodyphus dumicola]|uniref:TATA-binding protein-associated factor 172-like n=1 Tax=Stegodyphus dumicola TaxID=202533 RepID=UPI0015B0E8B1|nr:TATA-binding protein-associated factor 172-like [Stegodyphus dumicola]
MKFSEFDIDKVMKNGSNLLACESTNVDVFENAGMDPQEHLARQRQMLNKHLGLNFSSFIGLDTNYLSVEDFELDQKPNEIKKLDETETSNSAVNANDSMVKQFKIRTSSKNSITSHASNGPEYEPLKKKWRCDENSDPEEMSVDISNTENLWEESKQWPLEAFSDTLVHDLLNASWDIRHGAATALREIVRIHGKSAGKRADASPDQMEILNQLWLEDLALRLTCVLALDRFGDFISDQVIAPVRETCAQVLGAVTNIMSEDHVAKVLQILLQLLSRPEWEARHGGLLGLKYILSVRKDMNSFMIPLVFQPVCECLKDNVDDVSAVAAAALVPVTSTIVNTLPEKIPSVIASLWDALLDLDDLTVSTSSILQLLASLLSFASEHSSESYSNFEELIPRLWPFLSHNSSGVRKSVLQALITLTSSTSSQPCPSWHPGILQPALRLLFQRCLIEPLPEIHDFLFTVWKNIISQAPLISVISSVISYLSSWLTMLMQPSTVPIDPNVNSAWLEVPHKLKDKMCARGRNSGISGCSRVVQEQYYIGGNDSINESFKEREKCVARARMTGAKFIGFLSSYITKPIPGVLYPPETETPTESFVKLVLFHLNWKSALQRLAVSLVLSEWAKFDENNTCPDSIKEKCLECLSETVYYDEIAVAFTRLQQDCKDFIALLKHYSVPVDQYFQTG